MVSFISQTPLGSLFVSPPWLLLATLFLILACLTLVLCFNSEEGLEADVGDAEWDLAMPFGTPSKGNNSDTESQPLSTDTIVAPPDIPVVLALAFYYEFFV